MWGSGRSCPQPSRRCPPPLRCGPTQGRTPAHLLNAQTGSLALLLCHCKSHLPPLQSGRAVTGDRRIHSREQQEQNDKRQYRWPQLKPCCLTALCERSQAKDTSYSLMLSSNRKATVSEFKGVVRVDVREYYEASPARYVVLLRTSHQQLRHALILPTPCEHICQLAELSISAHRTIDIPLNNITTPPFIDEFRSCQPATVITVRASSGARSTLASGSVQSRYNLANCCCRRRAC